MIRKEPIIHLNYRSKAQEHFQNNCANKKNTDIEVQDCSFAFQGSSDEAVLEDCLLHLMMNLRKKVIRSMF